MHSFSLCFSVHKSEQNQRIPKFLMDETCQAEHKEGNPEVWVVQTSTEWAAECQKKEKAEAEAGIERGPQKVIQKQAMLDT